MNNKLEELKDAVKRSDIMAIIQLKDKFSAEDLKNPETEQVYRTAMNMISE